MSGSCLKLGGRETGEADMLYLLYKSWDFFPFLVGSFNLKTDQS